MVMEHPDLPFASAEQQQRFGELLAESVALHGHLCAGQVIGVRMSMLGLHHIGIADPKGEDRKKIYVIVEIDRCATDAIQSVTGCSLGKRSLRWLDHGIMAATFVNLANSKAVRITAREESRELAKQRCPGIVDRHQRQLQAYQQLSDTELFRVQQVRVTVPDIDRPGRPLYRVACRRCGDWVQDGREIKTQDGPLCKSCHNGAYFAVCDP